MNSRRARIAPFAATLLLAFGLTACGGGDDSKPQSTATAMDPPTALPAQSPAPEPAVPSPSQPAPTPEPSVPTVADAIGSATVQWSAPQEKTDGSVLQNLAGFTIFYGTSAHNLSKVIRVDNPSIDQYVVEQLPAGTYYFGVKAHDADGAESELSNLMTKVIG